MINYGNNLEEMDIKGERKIGGGMRTKTGRKKEVNGVI